jgi:hypothetical protein
MQCIYSTLMTCLNCGRFVSLGSWWCERDCLDLVRLWVLPGQHCCGKEAKPFVLLERQSAPAKPSRDSTMLYSTLFQANFWQCSCRSVTGSFPVQEAGATKAFGFGGCGAAGSFGGVPAASGLPLCFALTGGGSGSDGFGGLGSLGVFFAMSIY